METKKLDREIIELLILMSQKCTKQCALLEKKTPQNIHPSPNYIFGKVKKNRRPSLYFLKYSSISNSSERDIYERPQFD